MLKRLFIISLFFVIFSASNSFSDSQQNAQAPKAPQNPQGQQGVKQRVKGPVVVTSETLFHDNKANTSLFEKNVIVRTTDMTLYADKMLVYYTENGGDITKIEATGNIKLLKNTRVITSKEATYYADQDKVIFTGDPRAVDGENVVTGTKITYFITDDRSFVEKSKVFLKNKKDEKEQ